MLVYNIIRADPLCVTLKDLCQQDKEKVKKLVQDLAMVGTEKVVTKKLIVCQVCCDISVHV